MSSTRRTGVDGVMDVAIAEGKIAEVAPSIDAAKAKRVVNARGLYVVPGLIDLHAHVFLGTEPDAYLSNGVVGVPPTTTPSAPGKRRSWTWGARAGATSITSRRASSIARTPASWPSSTSSAAA